MAVPILILASASPRRAALLKEWKIPCRVRPAPGVDESHASGTPLEVASALARMKAKAALGSIEEEGTAPRGLLVLGADTVVNLDGEVLGKPRDRDEAGTMIGRLQGRPHRVITALALARGGPRVRLETETSEVTFHPLSPAEIEAYLGTGDWEGKAGAYGIQSEGARLVAGFRGCYYNIVGLPIARLVRMLHHEGFAAPGLPAGRLACGCARQPLSRGAGGCGETAR